MSETRLINIKKNNIQRFGFWLFCLNINGLRWLVPTLLKTLCLLLLQPVYAGNYQMDFPIKLNKVEVAQVSATLNGFELASISAAEFSQKMNKVLSKEVNAWLLDQGEKEITPEQYQEKGIFLTLQMQDLVILLSLSESAMSIDSLSYEQGKYMVRPTQEANWALLSQFNLNHPHFLRFFFPVHFT